MASNWWDEYKTADESPKAGKGGDKWWDQYKTADGAPGDTPERSWTEALVTDPAASLLGGLVSVSKLPAMAIDRAKTGMWIGPGVEALQEFEDSVNAQKSDRLRAKEQQSQARVAAVGQRAADAVGGGDGFLPTTARIATEFGAGAYEALKDPALLASQVAQQVPMLGASRLGGLLAAKAAQTAAGAAPAIAATKIGQAALTEAGTAGAVATGAGLQASDIGSDAYQRLMRLPDQQWATFPGFNDLAAKIGSEEAKARLASDKAWVAALQAGAASVLSTMLPGGTSIERALVGGKASGVSPIRALASGARGEFVQEGIEEGLGQVAANEAVRDVDPKQSLAEGVGAAAGQGAALGGLLGGGAAAASLVAARRAGIAPTSSANPANPANPQAPQGRETPVQGAPSKPQQGANAEPIAASEILGEEPAQPADNAPRETSGKQSIDLWSLSPDAQDAIKYGNGNISHAIELAREFEADDPERWSKVIPELIAASTKINTSPGNLPKPAFTPGAETTFSTETGSRLQAQYALAEADALHTSHDEDLRQNPAYPQELQPRQRDRAASAQQISQIEQRFDPARVGQSADAATGAPIVGDDGVVESGNARTIALKRIYWGAGEGAKAHEYRDFLRAHASEFGLTPEQVDGLKKPVLVRVRTTPVDRAEFARQANAPTVAAMSPVEQARADAGRIEHMDDLQPDDNGDFATSRDFIRRFMARLPTTEQAGMIDADGRLSSTGYSRVRNAVLAKAYGSSPTLTRMVESLDDNQRNVSKALIMAAPRVAQELGAIASGDRFDADLAPHLVAAANELSALRAQGQSIQDALAQTDLTGDRAPETAALLKFLGENLRRPRRIADFVQAYYDQLDAHGNPKQESLLGAQEPPTVLGLIEHAEKAVTPAPEPQSNVVPMPGQDWKLFPQESGTLGVPRAQMPQVAIRHRAALLSYLQSVGIDHQREDVQASTLTPTQAEYSESKTERAGGIADDRSDASAVLVSSDGYVLDGHHRWLAKARVGQPVNTIRFDAPIERLIEAVREFAGTTTSSESADAIRAQRAKHVQGFYDAAADLAQIMSKHTRAAMMPEDTPGLMPALVKLFTEAIGVVGTNMKLARAWVRDRMRAMPEFKKTWNLISEDTYRKAAMQALENIEKAGSEGDLLSGSNEPQLIVGENAPPKSKPVVLVFGGSFNPVHAGHVMAAESAREMLIRAGYKVEKVVVSPSPRRLLKAKSGAEAQELTDRTAMAKIAFKGKPWAEVTEAPSREAEQTEGKLKRTQQADWARKQFPDASIISLTGQDAAPGHPPGFPSIYQGDPGTSHEGYYYFAVPRDENSADNISSSAIRKLIASGQDVPGAWQSADIVRYFRALKGMTGETAIDGHLYDLDAPHFGLPLPQETTPNSSPLLEHTEHKKTAEFEGADGKVVTISREQLRNEIEAGAFAGIEPAPAGTRPVLYVMGGGGAAGKGTIMRLLRSAGKIAPPHEAVHLDPDKVKEHIPEYAKLIAAGDTRAADVVHEESSALVKRIRNKAREGRYNVLLDVTLGDRKKGLETLQQFKDAGYEIRLFGITIDPATAAVRAIKRATEPGPDRGRWVPMKELLKAHRGFTPAFSDYAALADQAILYDNSNGARVLLAEKKPGSDVQIVDQEGYNRAVQRAEVVDVDATTIRGIREGVQGLQRRGGELAGAGAQSLGSSVQGEDGRGSGPRNDASGSQATGPVAGNDRPTRARSDGSTQGKRTAVEGDLFGEPAADNRPSDAGSGAVSAGDAQGQRRTAAVPAGSRGEDQLAGRLDGAGREAGQGMGQAPVPGAGRQDEHGRLGGDRGRSRRHAGVPAGRDIPPKSGRNYRFSDADVSTAGSWQVKAERNIAAVELLKKLQKEGRQATPEEQSVLARFIGWGASDIANNIFDERRLRAADSALNSYDRAVKAFEARGNAPMRFDPMRGSYSAPEGWWSAIEVLRTKDPEMSYYTRKEITREELDSAAPSRSARKWLELHNRLKAALTPEEFRAAARTTQYAHFTSAGVVRSIWRGLERLGFKGGAILEPGGGVGIFPGLMPQGIANNSIYTGIEYDPITGGILQQLQPDENARVESYIDSVLPRDFYDIGIGNPPFSASAVLADKEYAKLALPLHDYFFAKTIDRVRPGGIVAFVTSRYSMDRKGDKARKYLAERADLIGAIRLPQTAFKANAGTDVVTDVLFLRKKVPGETFEGAQPWLETKPMQVGGSTFDVNEYFHARPEMVLGQHSDTGKMANSADPQYTVTAPAGEIEALFDQAVLRLPENVMATVRGSSSEAARVRDIDLNPSVQKEGSYYISAKGVLMQREDGVGRPAELRKADDEPVVRSYIPLRDAVKQAMLDQLDDGPWEQSLQAVRKAYDAFVKAHGAINQSITRRVKVKVAELDEDGEPTGRRLDDIEERRSYPLLDKLKGDPDYTLVAALEDVDAETGATKPSSFHTGRMIGGARRELKIVTPHDALLTVLGDTGRVDMEEIADRLGVTEKDAAEALGSAVYRNPVGNEWETADAYLSGNVKQKLLEAEQAARSDRGIERNVEALKAVQPIAKGPGEINPWIGQNWIPTHFYEQFLHEITGVNATVTWNDATRQWSVTMDDRKGDNARRRQWQRPVELSHETAAATADWGTKHVHAGEILKHALTGQPIKVTTPVKDAKGVEHDVIDASETEAAMERLNKMRGAFTDWIWKDAGRTAELVREYNDRFNAIVPRKFDGSHLTLPGSSRLIDLYPHVKRGAWRIVQSGNTYLAHAVGSGKTFQMVAAMMEERRLGLSKKPMVVVPNHMLQQFAREWRQLYPAAKLLIADEENFHTDNRRRFTSRAALSDLDAIIITHDAFKLLDIDPEFRASIIEEQLQYMRAALEDAEKAEGFSGKGRKPPTVKQIERRIESLEQRLQKAMQAGSKKDANVRFDELGVDRLVVDEAHTYRKLDYATSRQVKGLSPDGSQRALDLYAKVRWLESKRPGRSIVMASGTPITNTIAELYSVQRFMDPEQLERAGIQDFDSWAAQFGRETTALERNAGGRYEPVTRFNNFANVPELSRMFRDFADVLTADELAELLGDKRPKMAGGTRQIIVTPQTEEFRKAQRGLTARFEVSKNWKPSKEEPNNPDPVIAIITDGRLAAIDHRFINPKAPNDPGSKLNKMMDDVIRVFRETKGIEYTKKGKVLPVKGAAMMVFSDLGFGEGVAKSRGFSARAWAEKRLRDAKIPISQVAFMSDFKNSYEKAKLFKDVNEGRVRILFGSSKNMGTGVNAQERLLYEFHLDSPWFPADLEQREGRMIRQGNLNPEVHSLAYATKGSYDQQMWQSLASKQRFIDLMLQGDESVREIQDMDSASAMQTASAMVAEDPRVLELAGKEADLKRYERLYAAHEDQRARFIEEVRAAEQAAAWNEAMLPAAEKAAAQVRDITGDAFVAKAGGKTFTKRTDWGEAIKAAVEGLVAQAAPSKVIGDVSGFAVRFASVRSESSYEWKVMLETPEAAVLLDTPSTAPHVMAMRAAAALDQVRRLPQAMRERIAAADAKADALRPRIDAKFPMAEMMAQLRREIAKLKAAIEASTADKTFRVERIADGLGFDVRAQNAEQAIEKAIKNNGGEPGDWRAVQAEPKANEEGATYVNTQQADRGTLGEPARNDDAQLLLFGQQLDLFLDSKSVATQAGPGVEKARAAAADAVRVLGGSSSLLGKALASGLAARQRTSLVGRIVRTPADLATLAQLYRDPRFETFRLFFVKQGQIVSQVGITSRLPGSTQVIIGTDDRSYMNRLVAEAKKAGADGVWMMHNHPSGQATPSSADQSITRNFTFTMADAKMKMLGHVVIDTNEYAHIKPGGDFSLKQHDFGAAQPYDSSEAYAGSKIGSPKDVMEIARKLSVDDGAVTLMVLSYRHVVRAITTIPKVMVDAIKSKPGTARQAILRATMAGTGANVVAVTRDEDVAYGLQRSGLVLDAVHIKDDGSVASMAEKNGMARAKAWPNERRPRITADTSPMFDYLRRIPVDRHGRLRAAEAAQAYDAQQQARTAEERAEQIVQASAATPKPIDAAARFLTRATGVERLASMAYGLGARLIDRLVPESVKAGLVSDYGVPEAVIDRRATLSAAMRTQLHTAGTLLDRISTMTRAEARVAYEWMNMDGSDPRAYMSAMQGLPEESIAVLQQVQQMIDQLSKEAVRLGQLDPEAYKRHAGAYLRRSYFKHAQELQPGEKAARARAITILGDQYKGRGMTAAVAMDRVKSLAPEWWKRRLEAGKADTSLKGEKFERLERRESTGERTTAMHEVGRQTRPGKLLEVNYWPAGQPKPAKYQDWDSAGTWEVRDTKGDKLVMWRDFTKEEREKMGEIDEARYAIAKTLHGMIHDIEVGKYLEWLSRTQAKVDGDEIDGPIVEASERMKDVFKPGEWVQVPDKTVSGTNVKMFGALAGKYIPGPVWNDLRQIVGGQFKPFGETYQEILRLWKLSKTALSPAVHMNNVMSNFVMADWHDVSAGHVSKAMRILMAGIDTERKGLLGFAARAGHKVGIADTEAAREVLRRYEASGGAIGSWATAELAREQLEPIAEALRAEVAAAQSPAGEIGVYAALQHLMHARFPQAWESFRQAKSTKAVRTEGANLIDLYQSEDDVFRLAAWLRAKEQGLTDNEAGKIARKSFLDYNINAPWVQAMRSTALPFVSFTYRAVPMLIETAAKKPHKLFKLMMLAGAVNALGVMIGGGGDDKERKLLPDEKAGGIWGIVPKLIRMPWNDAHGSPVYLDIRRWIPVGDVLDVGQGHAAFGVPPWLLPGGPLALIGELMANKSSFTGRPITLETDTALEKAGKVADYLYKAFAPNLLGLPGTYATQGVIDAAKGRTDAFGREMSAATAAMNAMGVKLGAYPADVLRRNLIAKRNAEIAEIDRDIAGMRRQMQTHQITEEEFQHELQRQRAKENRIRREVAAKME